ncbi:hypothetical protein Z945_849 [Sulfitobacter noctilucae]|uniref:hypothetical protein n=1 Tax=Sulfitobacter noctilucae TaxID=1342302 RepID=UPI000B2BA319|nr:hypothetical protein [Sulfitobacter noctilucae]KIN65802.1 hypothetical protein Z945_849 [Sulfitobacter noctilucae]
MTNDINTAYRRATLPGLGEVLIPDGISDAQVLAEVLGEESAATSGKKTKKKP